MMYYYPILVTGRYCIVFTSLWRCQQLLSWCGRLSSSIRETGFLRSRQTDQCQILWKASWGKAEASCFIYERNITLTRGPLTLAICLTAAVGMTLAIFCKLVSKTHCCRLNQLKSRVGSHTVPHYACINFRSILTP